MPDVKGALTRKIGPLPAWGWGIAVGGAALGVKLLKGGGGAKDTRTTIEVPTGAPTYAPDELVSQLGTALDEIGDRLSDLENGIDNGETMPGPVVPPVTGAPKPATPPAQTTAPTPVTAMQSPQTIGDWLRHRGYAINPTRIPDYARTTWHAFNSYVDRQFAKTNTGLTDAQVLGALSSRDAYGFKKITVPLSSVPASARTSWAALTAWMNTQQVRAGSTIGMTPTAAR